jgi:hypothetical protein
MKTHASYIQVGEMKGANQTELETQINLMVYTAYPRQYPIAMSFTTRINFLIDFGVSNPICEQHIPISN